MKNRVRIIAPAGMYPKDSWKRLEKMKEFLASNGFEVSVQEDIFSDPELPFYANTKEIRLKGLMRAIQSDNVDIIWAFRGGYGCGEIAEDCMDIRPVGTKILIGFSDLTVLHVLFNQHYGIPSIHGMAILDRNPEAIDDIIGLINGEEQKLSLVPMNNSARNSAKIEAPLTGGNLTMVTTLIGTKLHPMTKGKILVLEDIAEQGYKIARMLNHLEKSGLTQGLAACILGDVTGGDEHVDFAIEQFAQNHPALSVFRADGIGHGSVNHPLVFGNKSIIENGILSCKLR